jgi:hypothetical protein
MSQYDAIHTATHLTEDGIHLASLCVALDMEGVMDAIKNCDYLLGNDFSQLVDAISNTTSHFDVHAAFLSGSSLAICLGVIVVSGARIYIHVTTEKKVDWKYVVREIFDAGVVCTAAILTESCTHMLIHIVLSVSSVTAGVCLSVIAGAFSGAYLGWNMGALFGKLYTYITGKETKSIYWKVAGAVLICGTIFAVSICFPPVGVAITSIAVTASVICALRKWLDKSKVRIEHWKCD